MHEIIALRCQKYDVFDSDKIIEVLLKTGEVVPIETVIEGIKLGDVFYISVSDEKIPVRSAYPLFKSSYVYSNPNPSFDKLGSLPPF